MTYDPYRAERAEQTAADWQAELDAIARAKAEFLVVATTFAFNHNPAGTPRYVRAYIDDFLADVFAVRKRHAEDGLEEACSDMENSL